MNVIFFIQVIANLTVIMMPQIVIPIDPICQISRKKKNDFSQ